ncbi:hypothetical protein KIN20_008420 [Parelaphostrongylus tenuis]|uniref:Uncharacterized protein n=1 Tax=Parelaphostrongylus tenuis TaxID=148309 RepID=A0AAD5MWR9_PARTN|nr:hypothetical protein KIN20_008420 [Parelaphostrongylus tenuis]
MERSQCSAASCLHSRLCSIRLYPFPISADQYVNDRRFESFDEVEEEYNDDHIRHQLVVRIALIDHFEALDIPLIPTDNTSMSPHQLYHK